MTKISDTALRAGLRVVADALAKKGPLLSRAAPLLRNPSAEVLNVARAAVLRAAEVEAEHARPIPDLGFGEGFDDAP